MLTSEILTAQNGINITKSIQGQKLLAIIFNLCK